MEDINVGGMNIEVERILRKSYEAICVSHTPVLINNKGCEDAIFLVLPIRYRGNVTIKNLFEIHDDPGYFYIMQLECDDSQLSNPNANIRGIEYLVWGIAKMDSDSFENIEIEPKVTSHPFLDKILKKFDKSINDHIESQLDHHYSVKASNIGQCNLLINNTIIDQLKSAGNVYLYAYKGFLICGFYDLLDDERISVLQTKTLLNIFSHIENVGLTKIENW